MSKGVLREFTNALVQSGICEPSIFVQATNKSGLLTTYELWKEHYFQVSAIEIRFICLGGMIDCVQTREQIIDVAELLKSFRDDPVNTPFIEKLGSLATRFRA